MNRLRRWYVTGGVAVLAATVLSCLSARAADPPDEPKWYFDRSLTLTPAPEPVPALRYRLYPFASELKEGNAVPIYLRLAYERNDATQREWREKPAAWNKLPLDQLPVREARQFLRQNAYMMKQLELGARRRSAEWNYTLDAGDPIGILLPDAQMMRVYAGFLVLQARVQIAEGDYAAAAHTLQTGFAFSRQVAEGPFLINGLVAIAIASQMADVVLDWVGRADAPNLYWSLTALPRPVIDLRQEFELERHMVVLEYPELADLKHDRSPAEWDATLKRLRLQFERFWAIDQAVSEKRGKKIVPLPGPASTEPAADSPELPPARRYLITRLQIPAAKVEAMPPAQVLLLYVAAMNDEIQDDVYKGMYLPAGQAMPVIEAAQKRQKARPLTEATRIPLTFIAALEKVVLAQNRLERKVAALRVIEAVRLHAVGGGRLPDELAEIREVPVPNDPLTGKPFDYRLDQGTATLTSRVPGQSPDKEGLRFRLSIRKGT